MSPPLREVRVLIARVCAGLAPDLPEHQAAVLLLWARETGPNVDRLVLRTGLPREFVARCLRRLTDNACWDNGRLLTTWCEDPSACKDFWLDVEVALGRHLRRIDEDGKPEWAPTGEWVKDFDYRGARSTDETLQTYYYEIPPHDPPPASLAEDAGENAPAPVVRESPSGSEPPVPPPASPDVTWLGLPSDASPETDTKQSTPVPLLVDTWSGAEWLT